MGFSINSNIDALRAYNALATVNAQTSKAQLRLATGKRINSVADDTSGYAVGKSLDQKSQLMQSAQKNVGSAQDMLSTAESQLSSVKDLITSIKTKLSDSTNPASDNKKVADDIKALATEIANIFSTTKFNDTQLLSSISTEAFSFQTGADASDKLKIDYANTANGTLAMTGTNAKTVTNTLYTVSNVGDVVYQVLESMAIVSGTVGSTFSNSIANLSTVLNSFESAIDSAISKVGNYEQRLSIKSDFLTAAIANSQASVGRLFDANVAQEQLNSTRGQIQQQVATSMLSQLNSAPQNLLSLFR